MRGPCVRCLQTIDRYWWAAEGRGTSLGADEKRQGSSRRWREERKQRNEYTSWYWECEGVSGGLSALSRSSWKLFRSLSLRRLSGDISRMHDRFTFEPP